MKSFEHNRWFTATETEVFQQDDPTRNSCVMSFSEDGELIAVAFKKADRHCSAEELERRYAPDGGQLDDGHPTYTTGDWVVEVCQELTRKGYWQWVVEKIAEE